MKRDEAQTGFSPQRADAASGLTRRTFMRAGVAAAGVLAASAPAFSARIPSESAASATASSFLDLVRVPDSVTVFQSFKQTMPSDRISLSRAGESWTGAQVEVETRVKQESLVLTLHAPSSAIAAAHIRWNGQTKPDLVVLGDAWERSYGELGWSNIIPERVLPWYFATFDGHACHAYGVKTDARALCFWQLDPEGISLWLNVTNGGSGVELGERLLTMATVVTHRGSDGESSFDSIAALCRTMCARPSRPINPIYGANDWDYSYGQSTAESILRDTDFLIEMSPTAGERPFSVIDGGWTNNTPAWPDMGKLAAEIRKRTARPGIWVRPLEALAGTPSGLQLPAARFGSRKDRAAELAYDPTIPEAQAAIRAKLGQAADWGYEMVKHDFSTYDLLGQWGFEMGPQPTHPGWSLHDRTRTNAEVIAGLYALIREAAGSKIVIDGCNTVGHLGQGVFDMQRTGDDTSGHQWERTRRMGVNTLSFRLPQNGTFFTIDPDLVGLTDGVPWELNRQWLDVLARSGAATIVSSAPNMRGKEQRDALREAFQIASTGGAGARPTDWMHSSVPEHWQSAHSAHSEISYKWNDAEGASAFLQP